MPTNSQLNTVSRYHTDHTDPKTKNPPLASPRMAFLLHITTVIKDIMSFSFQSSAPALVINAPKSTIVPIRKHILGAVVFGSFSSVKTRIELWLDGEMRVLALNIRPNARRQILRARIES